MRLSEHLATVLVVAVLAVATLVAQDPLVVNPGAYQLVFENSWVKVVRVRYAPHEVIAPHFHTALPSAYVYLNDGGPIVFKHHDLPYGAVTRPPTRAGSFRVYRGLKEVHAVENPTDAASDFLRVEFKTEPVDETTLKGKFFRDEVAPSEGVVRVQFENAQIRITRLVSAVRRPVEFVAAAEWPALVMALVPGTVRLEPRPAGDPHRLAAGDLVWVDPAHRVVLEGPPDSPAEFLGFEFKTRPVTAGTGDR